MRWSTPRLGWIRWLDNPYSQTCWHKVILKTSSQFMVTKAASSKPAEQAGQGFKILGWLPWFSWGNHHLVKVQPREQTLSCKLQTRWRAPKWALQPPRQVVDGNKGLKGIFPWEHWMSSTRKNNDLCAEGMCHRRGRWMQLLWEAYGTAVTSDKWKMPYSVRGADGCWARDQF